MTDTPGTPPPASDGPLTERIVVGVDASDGSLAALRWAMHEALLRGVGLHAVIAWSYHSNWGDSRWGTMFTFPAGYGLSAGMLRPSMPADVAPQRTDADVNVMAAEVLDEAIRLALEQDRSGERVTITRHAQEGPAAKVLLDAVTEADLLVVGTRGHGGFVGALLGSVSHQVVAQARCPVVVVPDAHHPNVVKG